MKKNICSQRLVHMHRKFNFSILYIFICNSLNFKSFFITSSYGTGTTKKKTAIVFFPLFFPNLFPSSPNSCGSHPISNMIRGIRNLDGNGQWNRQVELSRTFLPFPPLGYSQVPVHNAGTYWESRVKSGNRRRNGRDSLTRKKRERLHSVLICSKHHVPFTLCLYDRGSTHLINYLLNI